MALKGAAPRRRPPREAALGAASPHPGGPPPGSSGTPAAPPLPPAPARGRGRAGGAARLKIGSAAAGRRLPALRSVSQHGERRAAPRGQRLREPLEALGARRGRKERRGAARLPGRPAARLPPSAAQRKKVASRSTFAGLQRLKGVSRVKLVCVDVLGLVCTEQRERGEVLALQDSSCP